MINKRLIEISGDEWEASEPEQSEWIELCGLNPDDLD